MRLHRLVAFVSGLLLAACNTSPAIDGPTIRLGSATLEARAAVDVSALADRDTGTALAIAGSETLTLRFDHDVELRELRIHGTGVGISGEGFEAPRSAAGGWSVVTATAPHRGRSFSVTLSPAAPGARVAEVEAWGAGRALAPRDPEVLAKATREERSKFEDVLVLRGSTTDAQLDPEGLQAGESCVRTHFQVPAPRAARRAYLAYEANVQRAVVLTRSVGGEPPVGGFWLRATDESRTIVDELDPERLTATDEVLLCLPIEATDSVRVEGLRLVLVLDSGVDAFDRETRVRLGAAVDGANDSAASLGAEPQELAFDRLLALDGAVVRAAMPARLASAAAHAAGEWTSLSVASEGEDATVLDVSGRTADAMAVTFAATGRADVPAARVVEFSASGSGVGPRVGAARIVVTYPSLAWRSGAYAGERIGDRAFLQGWAESPAGVGRVEVAGARVDVGGSFAVPLSRPAGANPWIVDIRATFPDGTEVARSIVLDDDHEAEILREGAASGSALSDDRLFGRENQTAWGVIDPATGGRVALGTEVSIDVPAGAVAKKTSIGITRRGPEVVPQLDAGMINVTAPPHAGYRFAPAGQKFAKPVRITLPYAPGLLPEGLTPEDVRTYFYDEAQGRWQALPRAEVQRAASRIVSETTHFTFMVNAVLVLPDHPGPTSFNPNSIKDLKAADPTAGIDLVEPPAANNQGTAQLALPIRLPKARGAHQPELRLAYDSGGGNGWLGIGWDLPVSSVQMDTRFGTPPHDLDATSVMEGAERYVLDGDRLVPAASAGSQICTDGHTSGVLFRPRVERSFRRIVRCGADATTYWWEVTDKAGTLFVYGRHELTRLADPEELRIGQWLLERVVDANGNLTELAYDVDMLQSDDLDQHQDFRQEYLKLVRYSGKTDRTGANALDGGASGPYVVELRHEQANGKPLTRPDVITSGRLGFKVETRRRLASIEVRLEPEGGSTQTIREYRFGYERGSFGKSRMSRVALYGAGEGDARKLFYEHRFEYTDADMEDPFEDTRKWVFPDGADRLPITRTTETGFGIHGYAGIGPTFGKLSGSAGVRGGATHATADTDSVFADVNGDGLPDRLVRSAAGTVVAFNQGPSADRASAFAGTIEARLPPGDPSAGESIVTIPIDTLGHEKSEGVNVAGQAGFGFYPASFWANVGTTTTWTESDELLLDADGDGRVDYVKGNAIFFNQPRDRGDPFAFRADRGPEELASAPAEDDAEAGVIQDEANRRRPSSPLIEWLAPYSGTVDVVGALAFARTLTGGVDPAWDGVRLTVYRVDTDIDDETVTTTPLLTVDKKLAEVAAPSPVSLAVDVVPGTRLVFVLSTLADFPLDPEHPSPLEEVSFAPVVTYRGGDQRLVDPSGAPRFVFDAAKDFRLAGLPFSAVGAPAPGTLQIRSTLTKRPSTDGFTTCIQKFGPQDEVQPFPCDQSVAGMTVLASRSYGADERFDGRVVLDTFAVARGEKLVFRVDSDLPTDPGAIDWRIEGDMLSICDRAAAGCRTPTAEDESYAHFVVDPFVPVHLPVIKPEVLKFKFPPLPNPWPAQAWTPTVTGTYTIFTKTRSDGASGTTRPVFIAARTATRLLFKQKITDSAQKVEVTLSAGERVFFEAHADDDFALLWQPLVLAPGKAVPTAVPTSATWDAVDDGDKRYVLFSVFAGGFHGWRYGVWRSGDPFDAGKLRFDADAYDPGESDEDRDARAGELDAGGDDAQRLQLAAPLIPRHLGTWWSREKVGLAPFVPAYVTRDGATFITAGTMHASREGGYVETPDGTVTTSRSFALGKSVRKSGATSRTYSAGASLATVLSANGSIGIGTSLQKADLLDLNGDRVVDVVTGNGESPDLKLTRIHDLRSSEKTSLPGIALRETEDVTVSVGLGISAPSAKLDDQGNVQAVRGMIPGTGVGAGVNLGSTKRELVDINGDGLPDEVSRTFDPSRPTAGGCQGFEVHLNLGGKFAAGGDCIAVDPWSHRDLDPLSASLEGVQGVRKDVTTPDRVRRTTAITLQSNLGFSLNEDYAGGANWESSVSATAVALIDVTGDGLPDYVRKSPTDQAFYVMVNNGWGFEPERPWHLPAWPAAATKPWLDGSGLFGQAGKKVFDLVAGSEFIDAVEVNGTYSVAASVDVAYTFGVLVGPLTPWLHITVGGDVSPQRVSGYQLGMMDIDGDGLADHVLKAEERDQGSNEEVFVRTNRLGGANLLTRVVRPLGGSIDFHYARTRNSVDMPESRWVLDWTVVHDGRGATAVGEVVTGHDLRTEYEYEYGRYDRAEREFLGFAKVHERNYRSAATERVLARYVIRTYDNAAIAFKGLVQTEELRGEGEKLFTSTTYEYADPYRESAYRLQDGEASCDAAAPFVFGATHHYCGSLLPALKQVTRRFHEGRDESPITTVQSFGYDQFGNVVRFDDLGDATNDDAYTSDDQLATVVYSADSAARDLYSVGRPHRIELRDAKGQLLRKREGFYDARGNLERLVSWLDETRTVDSWLTWTDYGTIRELKGPEVKGDRYTVTYGYDDVTYSYVTSITDSHQYTSTAEYDFRFGEVTRTVDVNGNVTRSVPDSFGRPWRLYGPYDALAPTIEIEYGLWAKPAYARTKNRRPDAGTIDTVVLVDGLGRAIQTKKTAEVAVGEDASSTQVGWAVSGPQEWDALLRLASQGQAFFEAGGAATYAPRPPIHPSRFEYDALDRKVRTLEPVEASSNRARETLAETLITYDLAAFDGVRRFRATVVDPERKTCVMYRDPADRVVAVEEHGGTAAQLTRYGYDPVGQMTAVTDARGSLTRVGYDLLGRRTSIDNPDVGLVELELDAAGNLVAKRTPNLRGRGGAITYDYVFDQLVAIHYPNGRDVSYEYGAAGAQENGAGRVVRVVDDAGVETRGYGKLGELTRTTRTVPPLRPGDYAKTFETRFAFDSFGRMLRIQYPDGEVVGYGYDAGGLVDEAVGTRAGTQHEAPGTETYLSKLTYDVFGQRRRVELGNGAVSTYGYYPESRRLESLKTVAGGRTLQSLSYAYDRVGNVLGMTNALPASTGRRSGPVSYTYGYDDLYRLTSAKGTADARPGVVDTFEAAYEYDEIHNMTRNHQVHAVKTATDLGIETAYPPHTNHDFGYDYAGKGPHQATKIGDRFLTYDGNGNTLRECRDHGDPSCTTNGDHLRRFFWTDEDRLDAVIDGGGRNVTRFVYDAAGDRVAKLGRGGVGITVGQFFALKGHHAATKHVFVGEARLATKLIPPPGWQPPLDIASPVVVTTGETNDSGCVPSDDQPQKCPVFPAPDPVTKRRWDQTKVRPATYYYHPDHLGSTSWVTDQNGRVHEHVDYFPYGAVWRDPRSDSDGSPVKAQAFLFTGKELDEETGLYYYAARYLDPRYARFLSADDIAPDLANPSTQNKYSYVLNSPLNYVDPTGHQARRPAAEAERTAEAPPRDIGSMSRVARQTTAIEQLNTMGVRYGTIGPRGRVPKEEELARLEGFVIETRASRNTAETPLAGNLVPRQPLVVYPRGPGASEGPVPGGYVEVSRWVGPQEAALWIRNGGTHIPAEVGNGGRVYVTSPGAARPGGTGPIRIDFWVNAASLNRASRAEWFQIFQPVQNMPIHNVRVVFPAASGSATAR